MSEIKRRQVTGFAIDGPYSKDLDDAILLRKEGNGYVVVVSIADVSHTVIRDSDIDLRAKDLAFTRYFAQGNRPMLPRRLSEDLLSLLPKSDRDVVVFEIRLNDVFEVTDVKIELGRFRAPHRFTHKQVDEILENKNHARHSEWMMYYKFAESLLNRRRTSGAMVIYDLSVGLYTNEEGQVLKKAPGLYFRPQVIVQEFMILVNQKATEYLTNAGVPLLYRNHALLIANDGEENILRKLYGSAAEGLTAEALTELNARMRTLVGRARYEASCKGHVGLNLPAYAHWTSPIRRYADLVNHRQLAAWLRKLPYPYAIEDIASVGHHINAKTDEAKTIVSSIHRTNTVEEIRNAHEDELLKLGAGHFSLFIQLLAEGELLLTEMRAGVIQTKIRENALSLVDQVRILFTDASYEVLWRRVQEDVLQAMAVNPVSPQTMLDLARTQLEWVSSVRHTQVRDGVFSAEITITRGARSYTSALCEGAGKTDAEIRAFVDLLRNVTSIHVALPEGKKMPSDPSNYKGRLLELCQQSHWPMPTFTHSQSGPANQPLFACVVELQRLGTEPLATKPSSASTKKGAESAASKAMLELLGVKDQNPATPSVGDKAAKRAATNDDWRLNPISALQEYCQKRGCVYPAYVERSSGDNRAPTFTTTCTVTIDGVQHSFEAQGSNKKEAKRNAALSACEQVFGAA